MKRYIQKYRRMDESSFTEEEVRKLMEIPDVKASFNREYEEAMSFIGDTLTSTFRKKLPRGVKFSDPAIEDANYKEPSPFETIAYYFDFTLDIQVELIEDILGESLLSRFDRSWAQSYDLKAAIEDLLYEAFRALNYDEEIQSVRVYDIEETDLWNDLLSVVICLYVVPHAQGINIFYRVDPPLDAIENPALASEEMSFVKVPTEADADKLAKSARSAIRKALNAGGANQVKLSMSSRPIKIAEIMQYTIRFTIANDLPDFDLFERMVIEIMNDFAARYDGSPEVKKKSAVWEARRSSGIYWRNQAKKNTMYDMELNIGCSF